MPTAVRAEPTAVRAVPAVDATGASQEDSRPHPVVAGLEVLNGASMSLLLSVLQSTGHWQVDAKLSLRHALNTMI